MTFHLPWPEDRPLPIEARRDMDPDHDHFDRMLLGMMQAASVTVDEIPGVLVDIYVHQDPPAVHVRSIMADPANRIPGNVGRLLDALPRHSPVTVWAVTSRTLAEMLQRRGFECVAIMDYRLGMMDQGAMHRPAHTQPDQCGDCGHRHERGDACYVDA